MEHTKKQMSGSSSSSSFTTDLFGPKDCSPTSSSTGVFGSVFGPASMGLGRDSCHSRPAGKQQDFGSQYDNAKQGTPDYKPEKSHGETGSKNSCKDRSSSCQNETAEPCYFSSSIYYGGQEVYSPNSQTKNSHHTFKKDGGGDDSNGSNSNSASRGNWWQGSLYY